MTGGEESFFLLDRGKGKKNSPLFFFSFSLSPLSLSLARKRRQNLFFNNRRQQGLYAHAVQLRFAEPAPGAGVQRQCRGVQVARVRRGARGVAVGRVQGMKFDFCFFTSSFFFFFFFLTSHFFFPFPFPFQRQQQAWFQGTADAVRQYLWLFEEAVREGVEDYLILSGDHLYRMVRSFFFSRARGRVRREARKKTQIRKELKNLKKKLQNKTGLLRLRRRPPRRRRRHHRCSPALRGEGRRGVRRYEDRRVRPHRRVCRKGQRRRAARDARRHVGAWHRRQARGRGPLHRVDGDLRRESLSDPRAAVDGVPERQRFRQRGHPGGDGGR